MSNYISEYLGESKVTSKHVESGTIVETIAFSSDNAVVDRCSPTDFVALGLVSCIMSVIGMYADTHKLDVKGMKVSTIKTMADNPRRIGKIEMEITMPQNGFSEKDRISIERSTKSCPVYKSLHPDIEKVIVFSWL